MDDVLITGVTPEQHNQRLEEVFKRIQDKGLKASKETHSWCHRNMVDSYSKWIEYTEVHGYTTKIVNNKLSELFAKFDLPDKIVSDGGPAFISKNFKQFCDELKIQHILTPPYHPSSNGQAERMIGIVKNCQEREEHLSEIDETSGTSYFCGENNRKKPEVAYRNYNKINEIESQNKQYGNRQWPPTKYDGTLKKIKEI
ncbi:uncharacterized protein LOC135927102 [Gordionus sp. m RMFG-2023]|uniref:uncharacterized protein LOC135927102 n=1 Tax=Gordionus sp. m RMFG-2023 TaxID=3053472 RepID=UPI0031FDF2A9